MDRELVEGFYLDDLSYKALQVRHNLSEAAVRMRLLRARQKVRERVKELLSGVVMFRWRKALIGGGLETMKLGIKTKLIAAGVGILILLGGVGVFIWQNHSNTVPEHDLAGIATIETTQEKKISPPNAERHSQEAPDISLAEAEEFIAFLDELDKLVAKYKF